MSGRQSRRTDEHRNAVIRNLRAGVTRGDAARLAGMDEDTLRRWMRADAGMERACMEAEAQARARATAVIVDDAFGRPAVVDDRGHVIRAEVRPNVQSAMWYLERRDPLNWGRRVTVDLQGIVHRLARDAGLDEAEVWEEVEAIMAEAGSTFRRE